MLRIDPEVNKARCKAQYKAHREERNAYQKIYNDAHREKRNTYARAYRKIRREKIKDDQRIYRKIHRMEIKAQRKAYDEAHREEINAYARAYSAIQRATNIQFRLASRLRGRLHDALKGDQKAGSAARDLGCSIAALKLYLETQFQPGMTWDNWAVDGWHIDHVRPLASFDLTDREQFKQACHYTNLQPLWAEENLSKGVKVFESVFDTGG